MNNNYFTLRKITQVQLQEKFRNFLEDHQITFVEEKEGNAVSVKIPQSQAERVEQLLIESNDLFLENAPDDLYLRGFSDKELLGIITDPQDWGAIDFHLAVRILVERGIEVKRALPKVSVV